MLDWAREVIASVGLDDGFGFDDLVVFCAGATTVLTFGILLFRRPLAEFREFMADWRDFKRDWFGEEARDGRSRTPGVMERLNKIDGEFSRNGGSTMKDSQFRTERSVRTIQDAIVADDIYTQIVVEAIDANIQAVADVLEQAGHPRPAYRPIPPRPGMIDPTNDRSEP